MKYYWVIALIGWLPIGLLSCNRDASLGNTPRAVVEALFERIQAIKEAAKQPKKNGSTEQATKDLAASETGLNVLFLNPDKAKLLMMPLALIKSEEVEFIDEKIDGNKAEVTIEHTIAGFGLQTKLADTAQERRQLTFQLQKQKGRWMISDIGGVLARFGR